MCRDHIDGEERYCRARTVGVLDAYQNVGYHLAAPDLQGVFTKRLRMVIADLEASGHRNMLVILPENAPFGDLKKFFIACLRQFREPANALRRFLEECSQIIPAWLLSFSGNSYPQDTPMFRK